ncbi:hypothetical protein MWMV7_MWMV7_02304 [Acinetobacter calcoaceticus]|nr:hypothetical protein MWMV7_MWMV7_02304 [Acinetobacter calcoaceticus]
MFILFLIIGFKFLLIFWIQIFSIEKEQDAQKTNIPLGHYGYGCA